MKHLIRLFTLSKRRAGFSIRRRVILAMLLFGLCASLAFTYLWLPRITKILVDLETREVHRQLDIISDALLPVLANNEYASAYETLNSVLDHQDNWKQLILRRPDGGLLFPIAEPEPVIGINILNASHSIALRGREIAIVEASVDLSGAILLLTNEARTLGLMTVIIFSLSMFVLATFLDVYVGRRLKTLERAASELAAGNFNAALPPQSDDEVGVMTRGFSRMRDQIYDNEQSLITARKTAEQAAVAKTQFLATMSHEIRTPMNGVVPIADLLLRTDLNAVQTHYVKTIKSSGRALLTIIDDILDLSRLEAGRVSLSPAPFDLDELIRDVCTIISPGAFAKGVQLSSYIPRSLSGTYVGDVDRIRQVLLNLGGNAVKFTTTGAILIEVCHNPDADMGLEFVINDTGIGIEAADLDRIFDRFSQVDSSTSRDFGGSGLGLSISKRLVEVMQGNIRAESVAGKGSTFRFTLPLELVGKAPSASDDPLPLDASALVICAHPPAIDGFVYARTLNDWKLTCETVTSPEELIALLKGEGVRFDMVVIDDDCTDTDRRAFDEIIEGAPQLAGAGVIITSSASSAINASTTDPKSAQMLMKPVSSEVLVRTVREYIAPTVKTAEQPAEPQTADEGENAACEGRQLSILVADDNSINQDVARAILTGLNHKVFVVSNGSEAVDAVQTEDFDLILMDVHMPGMDGLGATRIIRDLKGPASEIPIVALTASTTPDDIDMCHRAGMDKFLAKPVTISKVKELLGTFQQSLAETEQG